MDLQMVRMLAVVVEDTLVSLVLILLDLVAVVVLVMVLVDQTQLKVVKVQQIPVLVLVVLVMDLDLEQVVKMADQVSALFVIRSKTLHKPSIDPLRDPQGVL